MVYNSVMVEEPTQNTNPTEAPDEPLSSEVEVTLEEAVPEDSEEYKYFEAAKPTISVGKKFGSNKLAFIPLSKAYRFAALYLTPEQIKQAALWKRPPGWPAFVPWCASMVKACQMWLNPNIGAAMEIADRTEGKVKQTLEVENRGVIALPMIQLASADEWKQMFAPAAPRELPPVTVEIVDNQTMDAPVVKRGRPRKHPKTD